MAAPLSALRRLYLSLYNWTVFLGWYPVLYLALKTLNESGHQHVYSAVERPLLLAQSAAVLEFLYGIAFDAGLVRSPITATLPQIGSRLYLTWGILWSFPEVRMQIQNESYCCRLGVICLLAPWSSAGLSPRQVLSDLHFLRFLLSSVFASVQLLLCLTFQNTFQIPNLSAIYIRLISLVKPVKFMLPSDVHCFNTCILMLIAIILTFSSVVIIRYSFFGMKEALGFAPSWLLWLR
ncbi:unnamed protein product [Malus baccata var. baccata]